MSSKLTRSVIKSIVKECLVEILSEGIGSDNNELRNLSEARRSSASDARSSRASSNRARRSTSGLPNRTASALDKISFDNVQNTQGKRRDTKEFINSVNEVANSMTSDPVLGSILADTAMTTLQEQAGADRKGPGGMNIPTAAAGDQAARAAAASDPMDLFGESASKWADLAFSPALPR